MEESKDEESPLTPESLRRISEEAGKPESTAESPMKMVGQLILFPLAIAGVCVSIFLLYSLLAQEERTPRDLLNDVRVGGSSRRWQAAYSLAALLSKADGKETGAALVPEMIRTFEEAKKDDPRVRQYLALSLGEIGDRRATPALILALEDADDQTRIFAIRSLGFLRDTSSVTALLTQAESNDPGIKKVVSHALGLLGDDRAIPALRGMLNSGDPNVRWNAALALCRFKDRSGLGVIEEMLDRDFLNRISAMNEEQREQAMLNALRGVVLLQERSFDQTLNRLKMKDPSLKVRQAAIDAIEALEQPR